MREKLRAWAEKHPIGFVLVPIVLYLIYMTPYGYLAMRGLIGKAATKPASQKVGKKEPAAHLGAAGFSCYN